MGQAAVALVLRHGHGHLVRIVSAALQCGDRLADDHLGGEAGVVVDVLLAQLDLVDGAQRQRLRPEAVLFQHAAEQAAEGLGHVGHQHHRNGQRSSCPPDNSGLHQITHDMSYLMQKKAPALFLHTSHDIAL